MHLTGVTMSMRVMSAGDGYQYLLKTVVAGDGLRDAGTPLTRYYLESGTPPGVWMGSGVEQFGDGELRPGMEVTERHLERLLGAGHDPVTGANLGREYPVYRTVTTKQGAVAGFDLTFSVPKSVSVLWAVSDGLTQSLVVDAHHAAIEDVVAMLEREVAATRTGVTAGNGAVAQVGVAGLAAAAFDHWDSRSGDPQLHTHVVVSNKVRTLLDGRWRSLDSRAIHAAVVALSEHYNAVLADRLALTLGVDWEQRARGRDRNPAWEIAAVPDSLVDEFSRRSRAIEVEKDRLIAEYVERHGKQPSRTTTIKLRAQATLVSRPEKTVRPLAELTEEWRSRASRILGRDAGEWARTVTTGHRHGTSTSALIDNEIERVAADVISAVSDKRATWKRWNLWAEASRQAMGIRFASAADREDAVTQIVEAAEAASTRLAPDELAISPVEFTRADGTSVFRPRHTIVYSSEQVLAAEADLLLMAVDTTAPRCTHQATAKASARVGLDAGQSAALDQIAGSGRRVDVLIGPAGAGKTTAMRGLLTAWVACHGRGSVVGLAPSAAAASVLAGDLDIACENTAKWLHEYLNGRVTLRRGQLVIVDEATLASTKTLLRLAQVVEQAGAKLLLVGDPAQLQSVEAGGAFAMLAAARPDVAELTEIHRFANDWERDASLALRSGDDTVIGTYLRHDRIESGTAEDVLDRGCRAWRSDTLGGLSSVLVADSTSSIVALNERARADRILMGQVTAGRDVELASGSRASVGDRIITRKNQRRLTTGTGWVRNGDRWTIVGVGRRGTVTVQREGGTGRVTLSADYVAAHVDLGYAVTTHRAQGLTVDTSHAVVNAMTTRENLYVAMTRGRHANTAYVALDNPDEAHAEPDPDATVISVLRGILRRSGAELSAHQTISAELDTWGSIAQLAAEYETLAAAAQRPRWIAAVHDSSLTTDEADNAIDSTAFGPLTALLRRIEAFGGDPEQLLQEAARRRSLADADDIAAVLVHRLHQLEPSAGSGREDVDLIAGLIPAVGEVDDPEMREALDERRELIEQRAANLAAEALRSRAPWLRRLGAQPVESQQQLRWQQHLATVAAYRDRYGINSVRPIGDRPESSAQQTDACLARTAWRCAVRLSPPIAIESSTGPRSHAHAVEM